MDDDHQGIFALAGCGASLLGSGPAQRSVAVATGISVTASRRRPAT